MKSRRIAFAATALAILMFVAGAEARPRQSRRAATRRQARARGLQQPKRPSADTLPKQFKTPSNKVIKLKSGAHATVMLAGTVPVKMTATQKRDAIAETRAALAEMYADLHNWTTPGIWMAPLGNNAHNTKMYAYPTVTQEWKVSQLKKVRHGGEFVTRLFLPVSGHVAALGPDSYFETALQYAGNNKFQVTVHHADGAKQTVLKDHTPNALAIAADFKLTLKPGLTTIHFDPYPGKTGGSASWGSIRQIKVHYDGTTSN